MQARTSTLIDGRRIVNPAVSYQDSIASIDAAHAASASPFQVIAQGEADSDGNVTWQQVDLGSFDPEQDRIDNAREASADPWRPKTHKVGTYCECGAPYVWLEDHQCWGYACAR